MTDPALKFWNGPSPSKAWEHCYIAAYSQKDAIKLYVEAGGSERGASSQIAHYFNACWGTAMRTLVSNPSRGVYLTDRFCRSVMYIEPKSRTEVEGVPEEAKQVAALAAIPEEYGRLRVGFQRGVKIDEWTYESPHHDRGLADKMKAEVRMQNAHVSGRRRGSDGGIEFVATSPIFGKGTELRHQNIDKLFAMVQEAFTTYDVAQRGIVWEDWLKVEVHAENPYGPEVEGGGLSIRYSVLKRGVDPRNGKVLTINNNKIVTEFPRPRAAGEKKREDDEWNTGDNHQIAFLPSTPENIAALDAIIVAINGARGKLEAILHHKKIAATLASIPSIPLLESK